MGPFALDNLTSLKYVAFVICFLLPILVPGPRVLAAVADNATFCGIGAIKLLLYIFFTQLLLRPKGILCYGRHTQPPPPHQPHQNEAQLEATPREDALTIITLASLGKAGQTQRLRVFVVCFVIIPTLFQMLFPFSQNG